MIAGVDQKRPTRTGASASRPYADTPPGDQNAIALDITGRDYVSYSSISTYQRCPLKYYFSYIVGLQPAFVSSSLVFGGAIHVAIEVHFRRLFEGQPAPVIDELVDAFDRAWRTDATRRVRYAKAETEESLRDLARRMLTAFRASEASKLDSTIIAIEEEFRAAVIPGAPDLLGRVDLVTLTSGGLHVIDFKTSRSRWSEAKVQESLPQMLLYAELVKPLAEGLGARELHLDWVVLTKAKNPVVENHCVTPSPRQIVRTTAMVRRVWEAIRAGHFYPVSSSNCATCPFAAACHTWEG